MKTVFNMSNGKEYEFVNDESAIQNLMNCYIIEEYGATQLYNSALRLEVALRVIVTEKGYGIGDYAILKEK